MLEPVPSIARQRPWLAFRVSPDVASAAARRRLLRALRIPSKLGRPPSGRRRQGRARAAAAGDAARGTARKLPVALERGDGSGTVGGRTT